MTVKELKELLNKCSDDTVVVKNYPLHWYSDSKELNIGENFNPYLLKKITDNKGNEINGKFLVLYTENDYDY